MRPVRLEWDGLDPRIESTIRALSPDPADVREDVAATIASVRTGGDEAVLDLVEQFDGARPASLRVDEAEIAASLDRIPAGLREALELAAANVERVARAQPAPEPVEVRLDQGQSVRIESRPVGAAGVYVPGGRASYPSSVIMGVLPARAAGVARVDVATPPGADGRVPAAVLAACAIVKADRVYAMGGAQAIAALALGTETVEAVDVIVGPGGPYVQEAKLLLADRVGGDGYAGPSELMVVCDASADLDALALDLGAQAEHGPDSLVIATSPDATVLDRLERRAEELAERSESVSDAPLALVLTPGLAVCVDLANRIAPEHLELAVSDAAALTSEISTAGCVFTGAGGATAFGDYVAGSNHVLPTGGAGKFRGPLGPAAFRRPISFVDLDRKAAGRLSPALGEIARAEGFPVHAESAEARAKEESE